MLSIFRRWFVPFIVAALALNSSVVSAQTIDPLSERVTVVMTEFEPFVFDDDGRADGFYAEIWDVVAAELGVDYDIVWVEAFSELSDWLRILRGGSR